MWPEHPSKNIPKKNAFGCCKLTQGIWPSQSSLRLDLPLLKSLGNDDGEAYENFT